MNTYQIVTLILGVTLLITISFFVYFLFSKSRKKKIKIAEKEAKQKAKIILEKSYREINNLKSTFENEKRNLESELETEKNRLKSERKILEKEQDLLEYKENRIISKELDIEKRKKEYDEKVNEVLKKLETISGLSQKEAKNIILEQVETRLGNEIVSLVKNAELVAYTRAKEISNNIIIEAMQKYATDIVNEKTSNIVKLPNDEMKGRVIGKDGRNIKAFEQYGGVDILVDETPGVVTISSFNPIRREIATRVLEKLIKDGRIQPVKIESELEIEAKELEATIIEKGYETIRELNINDMDIEMVKLVGKLKYRTSYGQSVLLHSIEVAKIAGSIAAELGLDVKEAVRAGLLHDIGKAVDFEEEGSHVLLGKKVAKRYGESDIVINTIASHHEDEPKNSEIAAIVAIADSISASRPGARNNTISDFISRMKEIEKICNEIPGVNQSYALQSGRQIRVIVDPIEVSDAELMNIVKRVEKGIVDNVIIPGEITITVIREKREIHIIK
ncbi:ribonuclease Y [Mesoplasma photuris]|uniref:ribonuclease Y n=1 Tax=Mesoplasma photuris TaxID=217731 RepID=UPI0004E25611|nr:ribonuclease Y [Mesoplasma photuris]